MVTEFDGFVQRLHIKNEIKRTTILFKIREQVIENSYNLLFYMHRNAYAITKLTILYLHTYINNYTE
jgi:hypothetical protein